MRSIAFDDSSLVLDDEAESTGPETVEYAFDGLDLVFSDKVALTPITEPGAP